MTILYMDNIGGAQTKNSAYAGWVIVLYTCIV